MLDDRELFEEAYYFPKQNKIYVCLIGRNRILAVYDDVFLVQWTPAFEANFERSVCLGTL